MKFGERDNSAEHCAYSWRLASAHWQVDKSIWWKAKIVSLKHKPITNLKNAQFSILVSPLSATL